MRRLIVLLLLAVGIVAVAHAAVTTGTFGDQNASKKYRVSTDTDGVIYFTTDAIYVDQTVYGSLQGVSYKATTTCGCKTFSNGLCVEKGTCS